MFPIVVACLVTGSWVAFLWICFESGARTGS